MVPLAAAAGCAQIGVMGPTVCENWVKPQFDRPETYSWNETEWNGDGPDVTLEFTVDIDGRRTAMQADCNFVDPDAEELEVDPSRSRVYPDRS